MVSSPATPCQHTSCCAPPPLRQLWHGIELAPASQFSRVTRAGCAAATLALLTSSPSACSPSCASPPASVASGQRRWECEQICLNFCSTGTWNRLPLEHISSCHHLFPAGHPPESVRKRRVRRKCTQANSEGSQRLP